MRVGTPPRASLDRLLALRGPGLSLGAATPHKEWLHFAVHAPDVDVVVNFSIVSSGPGTRRGQGSARVGRVAILVHTDRWQGGLERCPDAALAVRDAGTRLLLGESRLELRDGRFFLEATRSRTARPGAGSSFLGAGRRDGCVTPAARCVSRGPPPTTTTTGGASNGAPTSRGSGATRCRANRTSRGRSSSSGSRIERGSPIG